VWKAEGVHEGNLKRERGPHQQINTTRPRGKVARTGLQGPGEKKGNNGTGKHQSQPADLEMEEGMGGVKGFLSGPRARRSMLTDASDRLSHRAEKSGKVSRKSPLRPSLPNRKDGAGGSSKRTAEKDFYIIDARREETGSREEPGNDKLVPAQRRHGVEKKKTYQATIPKASADPREVGICSARGGPYRTSSTKQRPQCGSQRTDNLWADRSKG